MERSQSNDQPSSSDNNQVGYPVEDIRILTPENSSWEFRRARARQDRRKANKAARKARKRARQNEVHSTAVHGYFYGDIPRPEPLQSEHMDLAMRLAAPWGMSASDRRKLEAEAKAANFELPKNFGDFTGESSDVRHTEQPRGHKLMPSGRHKTQKSLDFKNRDSRWDQSTSGTQRFESLESPMKIRKIERPQYKADHNSEQSESSSSTIRKSCKNEGTLADLEKTAGASKSVGKFNKDNRVLDSEIDESSETYSRWRNSLSVSLNTTPIKSERPNVKSGGSAERSASSSEAFPQDVPGKPTLCHLETPLKRFGYWKQEEDQPNSEMGSSSSKCSTWRDPHFQEATSGFTIKPMKLESSSSKNLAVPREAEKVVFSFAKAAEQITTGSSKVAVSSEFTNVDIASTTNQSEQLHAETNMQKNLPSTSENLNVQNERKRVSFKLETQTRPNPTNAFSEFAGKSIKKEVECVVEFENVGNQKGFANSTRSFDIKPQIAKLAYPENFAKVYGKSTDETAKHSEQLHQESNMQKSLLASSEHLNIQNESQPVSFNYETQSGQNPTNALSEFAGKAIKTEVECVDEFEYGGNQKGFVNSPRSYDIKPQIAKLAYPENFAKVYGTSTDKTAQHSEQLHQELNMQKSFPASSEHLNIQNESQPASFNHATQSGQNPTNSFSGFAGKSIKIEVESADDFEYGGIGKGFANSPRSFEHLKVQNERKPVTFNFAAQNQQTATNSSNVEGTCSGFAKKSIKKENESVGSVVFDETRNIVPSSPHRYEMKPQIAKFAVPKNAEKIGGTLTDVSETAKQSEQLNEEKPTTSGTLNASRNE